MGGAKIITRPSRTCWPVRAYSCAITSSELSPLPRSLQSPATILQTLQGYYGGMYVSNFNRFGKIYRVMMQAAPESRVSPETSMISAIWR